MFNETPSDPRHCRASSPIVAVSAGHRKNSKSARREEPRRAHDIELTVVIPLRSDRISSRCRTGGCSASSGTSQGPRLTPAS